MLSLKNVMFGISLLFLSDTFSSILVVFRHCFNGF